MKPQVSFKFLDANLNRQLIALLKKQQMKFVIDETGAILYSRDDGELIENELICSIRDREFSPWRILTCPNDWVEQYKQYMAKHLVPFREELIDGELWFLIPRHYRPDQWKLQGPA